MHLQASQRSVTERDDEGTQRAVLALVLHEHPALLALSEVEREIDPGDSTQRAVRDLVGAGLLRREGASVLPTLAALRFERLETL